MKRLLRLVRVQSDLLGFRVYEGLLGRIRVSGALLLQASSESLVVVVGT